MLLTSPNSDRSLPPAGHAGLGATFLCAGNSARSIILYVVVIRVQLLLFGALWITIRFNWKFSLLALEQPILQNSFAGQVIRGKAEKEPAPKSVPELIHTLTVSENESPSSCLVFARSYQQFISGPSAPTYTPSVSEVEHAGFYPCVQRLHARVQKLVSPLCVIEPRKPIVVGGRTLVCGNR